MATLTKDQRDKLDADSFGDPARRLFPITDQEDLDSAAHLIGKAKNPAAVKARLIAIAKRKGLKLPDAWTEPAEMSADEWVVYPNAKLFEAGDYPDKGFTATPEDLWLAAENFEPCPVDLEHVPTVLSGKLGECRRIEVNAEGELRGEVAIPVWLDAVLGEGERKVSGTFDRATGHLTGLALVRNPRVKDAALMSAYAEFAGRRHSDADQQDMQAIHDLAARQGAACAGPERAAYYSAEAALAPTAEAASATETAERAGQSPGRRRMSEPTTKAPGWLDQLREWVKGNPEGGAVATAPPPVQMSQDEPPLTQALREQNRAETAQLSTGREKQLEAELARERAENIRIKARQFADQQIETEHRATPAAREAIIAAFTQAAHDDATAGVTVTFAEGGIPQSRVEILNAFFAKLPQGDDPTREVLPAAVPGKPGEASPTEVAGPNGTRALLNQETTPEPEAEPVQMSDERLAELLGKTTFGKEILAEKKGSK